MPIEVHAVDHSAPLIDLLNIRPEQVRIDDIAATLAKINRWGGRSPWPFSVARHSVLAAQLAPWHHKREMLLHDAVEAFVGDVPSPIKDALVAFEGLEALVRRQIAPVLGIAPVEPEWVKRYDRLALAEERRILAGAGYESNWRDDRDRFMAYYDRLTGSTGT